VKKPKIEPSKWAGPTRRPPDAALEKRRALWDALNTFVTKHGRWITSPPGTQDLRIEIPERSDLPAKLTELGYRPLNMGQATRLTNKPGAKSPWIVVDVICITMAAVPVRR
jgi:hypothetical protein